MRRRSTRSIVVPLLLCVFAAVCLITPAANAQDVWHVDIDAPPNGDGIDWATAFKSLQDAIDEADASQGGDIILVAEGTYVPSKRTVPSVPRTETFLLDFPELSIQAGFAGMNAPDPDLRDPVMFPTILSGNIPVPEGSSFPACDNPPPGAGNCSVGTPGVPGCTGFACCEEVCAAFPS